ncbi:MAG: restriction endonuclease subunit S, partial [Opitutaceae bacterium]
MRIPKSLPEGWGFHRLLDCCTPQQWPTLAKSELTPEGYMVFGANGPLGRYPKYNHEHETIAIGCRGACGTIQIIPPKSYVSGNAMCLDSVDEAVVSPAFLYHALSYRNVSDAVTGSAQPQITRNSLKRVALPRPPPDEQAAIARILDAVDTALERTRTAVARARELRESLLAELLSRGVGDDGKVRNPKRSPSQFVQTPLGLLPGAWTLSRVGKEFEIQNGFTINENREIRFPKRHYLRVANVQRDALDLDEIKELEAGDREFAPRVLAIDDLLVVEGHADRMQIGRCARVTAAAAGTTFQNHLFRLRTREAITPEFGCLWLNSTYALRYWNACCATSSGLNTINQRMLKRLVIPVPPKPEQEKITTVIAQQRKHLKALVAKQQGYETLKKSLMHDLLTGRVR